MRIALVASALLMIAPASALHAKIYDLDYSGVMLDGTSQGDLGAPGTDLTGDPFDLLFAFNYSPTTDDIYETDGHNGYFEDFGSGTSPVTAKFTVNGHTIDFDGSYLGVHIQEINPITGIEDVYDEDQDNDGPGSTPSDNFAFIHAVAAGPRGGLIGNNVADPDSLHSGPSTAPGYDGYFFLPDQTKGDFRTANFTVSIPGMRGALPEPGTWMMMIMGFGLIGWVLRRDGAGALRLRPPTFA